MAEILPPIAPDTLPPPQAQQEVPQAPQPQIPESVNVLNSEGALVSIPGDRLQEALSSGEFSPATEADIDHHLKVEKYGTGVEQLKTGLEGAASAATFGLSTGLERGLGVKPEDIQARREVNPGVHMIGQGAGLVGSSLLLPGAGSAGLLERGGASAAEAAGLGGAETVLQKIGSAAVKGAAENAMFQAGDENSKFLAGDPNQHIQTAVADIGLAGLLGAGVGGGIGAVNPLWEASKASKLGGTLGAISKRLGGIDGEAVNSPMSSVIAESGMELDPVIKAAIEGDRPVQELFSGLNQSDTTKSGLDVQKRFNQFRKDAGDTIIRSLGSTPEALEGAGPISTYEAGKNLGKTLSDEFNVKQSPLVREFEDLKGKYADAPLTKDQVIKGQKDFSNPYLPVQHPDQVIPGTASQLSEKIAQLAQKEGWTSSPSSDIMREVQRTIKELPLQKDLKDLGNFISQVGNNTNRDIMNGPLKRAGQLINSVLKEAEGNLAIEKLGKEAPELVNRMKIARESYKAQAVLKDALDERLKIGGSTSSFAKNLKEMAQTDGEGVLRRLSGKGDADLIQLLEKNYPKTAEALRQHHVASLLEQAANKAKGDSVINAKNLTASIAKMSPELRDFAIPKASQARIEAISSMLDHFGNMPHNYSNTARTIDKITQYLPGSALGMVSLLTGHNVASSIITGTLGKYLAKDLPDAVKLATLKFLGSSKPVSAIGFQSMVQTIQHGIEGQKLVTGAIKNLFKAGKEVLPQSAMPSDSALKALDKSLKEIQSNPQPLLNVGNKAAYYMPEHGQSAAQTASQAANYVNSQRPDNGQRAPLDAKHLPNPVQASAFKNTLTIAQQPLVVLDKISKGSLTPKDVMDIHAMYPDLYASLNQKLTDKIIDISSKGDVIPYKQRMAMSMFMGQPLDSTMTPAGIQGAQPLPKLDQQPENKGGQNSKSSLNKLAANYETVNQQREAEKQQGH